MSHTDRITRIRQLLASRALVSRQTFLDTLEVSPATLKRDLAFLRDNLNTPIVWDRELGGYRIDATQTTGKPTELPGLWFSDKDIHALLTMQHLLESLDAGGILAPQVAPLKERITALMGATDHTAEAVRQPVHIVSVGKRSTRLRHFETIGSALLKRKRLHIAYYARGSDALTERDVSPQRLVYYRENWYLDAWCHLRGALRNFAVDSIREAHALKMPATDTPAAELDAQLGPGYGIFAGPALHTARLRFSPERARWVATERWHANQHGRFDEAGYYLLDIPYADHRELMMDILKHGRHCEVLGPAGLRAVVVEEIAAMADLHVAERSGSRPEPLSSENASY